MYVSEDASMGDTVTTVLAEDADSGQYGVVTYHITSGSQGKFRIRETTVYIHDVKNMSNKLIIPIMYF